MRHSIVIFVLAVLLILFTACSFTPPALPPAESSAPQAVVSLEDNAKLRPLRVCLSFQTAPALPIIYAEETGLFEQAGLDVTIIQLDSGTTAVTSLIAGEADICSMGGAAVLNAAAAGENLKMFLGTSNKYEYILVVEPSIQTVEELSGAVLAISDFGSSSDVALRAALTELGLDAENDVTIVTVGGTSARLAALEAGSVQGTLISPGSLPRAVAIGLNPLLDMQTLDIPYPNNGLVAPARLLERDPEIVKTFVRAVFDAREAMRTDEAASKRIIADYLGLDPESDADLVDLNHQLLFTRYYSEPEPYPTVEGLQIMIEQLIAENPAMANITAEQVVDTRIVDELVKEGLFD
ncbi:MAG: ABC transporter substrate-binding protein [Caldilineales bacterium]|nr:ABC transporter substrate-binding protein [Caldilineales bacterium]